MKKKTNKDVKSQMSNVKSQKPKAATADKLKSTDFNVVKDSMAAYHSDKESVKSPSYTNSAIGKIEIVKDFLPTPDELVLRDATVKVTLNLSKSSVKFFKGLAEKHGSQYQKIIRIILDSYSSNYAGK